MSARNLPLDKVLTPHLTLAALAVLGGIALALTTERLTPALRQET